MEIRALKTPEELQIVRDIAERIWPETFREILSSEQLTYMMRMMYAPEVMEKELANGYHFDVLVIDGAPAGYVSYARYDVPETAKLHKIYLLSQFHRHGYGSWMLQHVIDRCREAGFRYLRLNVNKHNVRARASYLRNGFTDLESVKIDIGNGFYMDDFVMQKVL